MSLIYWFSDGVGDDVNEGGADTKTPIPTVLVRWIRANTPSLIIYGGDVYPAGKTKEFTEFFEQMDSDVSLMCEPPGNHDWLDDPDLPEIGRIPHGYETFWSAHPESKQPVDTLKRGGGRYEHAIDVDGWRLLFVDTGDYDTKPWPAGDADRKTWLTSAFKPGRANILVAHHSRLSCGHHGHNDKLKELWEALFDSTGPRVAFTIAGHDHNVNVYSPRSKGDPEGQPVPFANGIHVFVNGAGGAGFYSTGLFASGTKGDIFSNENSFCVTRINLIDDKSVDIDVLGFGKTASAPPTPFAQSLVKIRLP